MAKSNKPVQTPLMKQYNNIKAKHPDAILLFRVGDFYETFSEDAIKAADILGITLTKRANGAAQFVELAGFPHHALDTYLPKLVRAGQRVAICEQLEDPKLTKNIVKRGVTELVTPGVSLNENVLEHKENNFLACVYLDKNYGGISLLDLSTGEFLLTDGSFEYIDKLLSSFKPKEIIFDRQKRKDFTQLFGNKYYTYPLDEWVFNFDSANERLNKHFSTKSLKGFGVQNLKYGIIAAGAILHYLDLTEHRENQQITTLSRIEVDRFVWLDKFTIRNLELFDSLNDDAKTLIDIVDKTISPMGARMLKRWISMPLKDIQPISERLNVVEYFNENETLKLSVEEQIRQIGDIERIISKVAVNRISPREVLQLKFALSAIEPIKKACQNSSDSTLQKIGEQLNPCISIRERIEKELSNDPPNLISKGNIIKTNVLEELDNLREISGSSKNFILKIQNREIEKTGISSLKISFNNVFGYYIEVKNTHKDKVPPEWIRKQTLVNAERYITEELKDYETKILTAEEKIHEIEIRLFNDLVLGISDFIVPIQLNANLIAIIDCLLSFSTISKNNNYFRPEINDSVEIFIKQGRHPVIEKQLPIDEEYIPNDIFINNNDQQVVIITGPNMAGKSALLRQTALIVLMAQIGSFVPAVETKVGIVDKIFTRVGASDNISLGESTFMVEMNEAASILNNLSNRSLILFDELGRGTSTYDGISIAWAIVEYIHEHPKVKAKTLFATHYHELNEMEKSFSRIKNYNVAIKELDKNIIFLRKLKRGGSEHSFGIHVAKMAGMPKSIVKRANEILGQLEGNQKEQNLSKPTEEISKNREGYQLSFFQLDDPILEQIRDEIQKVDINNLTPIEALNMLNEVKKLIGKEEKKKRRRT